MQANTSVCLDLVYIGAATSILLALGYAALLFTCEAICTRQQARPRIIVITDHCSYQRLGYHQQLFAIRRGHIHRGLLFGHI